MTPETSNSAPRSATAFETESAESWRQTWRPLGSLKGGVLLLLLISGVLAAATFVEAAHGRVVSHRWFYQSWWFTVLLAALAVNLLATTLQRWPFGLRRIGFPLVHLGGLVILAGGMLTHYAGMDGRMRLTAGETSNTVTTTEQVVSVGLAGQAIESSPDFASIPLPMRGDRPRPGVLPPAARQGTELRFRIEEVISTTAWVTRYLPTAEGPGAVELGVGGGISGGSSPMWLAEGHRTSVGGIAIEFDAESRGDADAARSLRLVVGEGGSSAIHSLGDAMKFGVVVQEPPNQGPDRRLQVRVTAFHPDAVVGDGGVMGDRSAELLNPAVELEVSGPQGSERRVVFALLPDGYSSGSSARLYPDIHIGLDASGADRIYPLLRLSRAQDGLRYLAASQKSGVLTGSVRIGEPLAPEILGLRISVDRHLPHAIASAEPVPASTTNDTNAAPCLRIHAAAGAVSAEFWLGWHKPAEVLLSNVRYRFDYREASVTLPFAVTLDRCERQLHPGTAMPAMFLSHLLVRDADAQASEEAIVAVNLPMERAGYTVFQSGVERDGEKEVSVLAVSRDPGKPMVFSGFAMVSIGVVLMVLLRQGDASAGGGHG